MPLVLSWNALLSLLSYLMYSLDFPLSSVIHNCFGKGYPIEVPHHWNKNAYSLTKTSKFHLSSLPCPLCASSLLESSLGSYLKHSLGHPLLSCILWYALLSSTILKEKAGDIFHETTSQDKKHYIDGLLLSSASLNLVSRAFPGAEEQKTTATHTRWFVVCINTDIMMWFYSVPTCYGQASRRKSCDYSGDTGT